MTDIASNCESGCVSLKDIAQREHLSEKYLEQIINLLVKANLVKSIRGAKGGYLLTRAPEAITAQDILLATEGSLAPVACAADNDCCENYCDCVTSFVWTQIYNSVMSVVEKITLSDLVEKNKTVNKSIELECKK